MTLNHLSTFTGAGGFDLAFERAGAETVGQVEIDKYALKVLERHWPDVPRWHDIRGLALADIEEKIGDTHIDIITGGFPCQDISIAKAGRKGLDGERSGLWFDFARLVGEIVERQGRLWVVIENVSGLLSSNGGRDLGTILGTLGDYGFRYAYRMLDSRWFGVPQRRKRVFIVGNLGGPSPLEVLFDPDCLSGNPPPSREKEPSLAWVSEDGSEGSSVAATLLGASGGGFRAGIDGHGAYVVSQRDTTWAFTARSLGGVDDNDAQAGFLVPEVAYALTARDHKGISVREGANNLIPSERGVRRLTNTEVERLQGFPDGWTEAEGVPMTQRYKMCGNAVTVNTVEWIAQRIARAERGETATSEATVMRQLSLLDE